MTFVDRVWGGSSGFLWGEPLILEFVTFGVEYEFIMWIAGFLRGRIGFDWRASLFCFAVGVDGGDCC